ncbi:4Fe-4S dicluster domain-containing protein [Paracrocinitomix mangrovi]|uniref:4Fe-4S dicluster domain-containing protein n=1 Tax=Paracrocinitomix mangrovi TaxID=2862509 RepID=UPI001C8E0C0F|nr:4Fe-4S dicluster domain-containing protein [Paracrocinitomix mangrovi]UKN02454.1 4Fe-4S dicluster domain-containing protein [Paracrocinitomix mangrovi]
MEIGSIIFILIFLGSATFFGIKVKQIIDNIKLGKSLDRSDNKGERMKTMIRVALGQSKMVTRPIAGILHIFIYVAFVITQVELIEIIIDGATGNHRIFSEPLGGFYTFVISLIEVLSLLALIATFSFLARRNLLKIPRFVKSEMTGWPKLDGNIILYLEFLLVICIFTMNGADEALRLRGESHAAGSGSFGFAISSFTGDAIFGGMETGTLHLLERIGWWGHFAVVMAFLCYLPFSKHLHILWAFPNVYFSNLNPKGQFTNMEAVTNEVKLMLDPNADPFAAPPADENAEPQKFGAKDVTDLTWVNIMNAYTCTECGRCTSSCPANITGKKLSPRKIMMDVRDRAEEVGKGLRKNKDFNDGKSLLGDYITEEEVWACTSCNACVQECPVNIDPLSIIVDLRRYLVMEESKIPAELMTMNTNIENNQAPWQFSPSDRLNWKDED